MVNRSFVIVGHMLGLIACLLVVVTVMSRIPLPGGEALVIVAGVVFGCLIYSLMARGLILAKRDKRSLAEYLRGERPGE